MPLTRPDRAPAPETLAPLLAALLVLPLAPAGLAAQETGAEGAVLRTAHELHDALASGDSARVLELLSPDVRVYEAGHAETRSEYRSGHLSADIEFVGSMDREILAEQVRTSGDGVALYLSEYRMTGTFRGEEVDSHGTETLVMERGSDGWRIVHIHWSSR